jgi:hypothetical protein
MRVRVSGIAVCDFWQVFSREMWPGDDGSRRTRRAALREQRRVWDLY